MADPFDPIPYDDSEAVEFDDSPFAGEFTLQLQDFKAGTSQAGNPKVTWEFKVVDDDEYSERRVWHDTVTIGRGAGMFKAVISAFGYDPNEYLEQYGNQVTFEALAALVGEQVEARLKIEEPSDDVLARYPNASPRTRIDRFLS